MLAVESLDCGDSLIKRFIHCSAVHYKRNHWHRQGYPREYPTPLIFNARQVNEKGIFLHQFLENGISIEMTGDGARAIGAQRRGDRTISEREEDRGVVAHLSLVPFLWLTVYTLGLPALA